jgi:septum formation inhibitor-activating ATPase MinD
VLGSGKTAAVAAVGIALAAVHEDPSLVLTRSGLVKLGLGVAVGVWNAATRPVQERAAEPAIIDVPAGAEAGAPLLAATFADADGDAGEDVP